MSSDAPLDIFYRNYDNKFRCNLINDIHKRFDFHPLSINLFATGTYQNERNVNRWPENGRDGGRVWYGWNITTAVLVQSNFCSYPPLFQELDPMRERFWRSLPRSRKV